ncbi:MFS transporter [Lactobacillus kefiranofaciens]|uniref:MFS transporter n=1 Tax=Lactobacillus kefiranofaciens TaxID=267818 RepID=UPI002469B180|nr:MFS transporter [Lactobacillus kefiranofaciens]MDH5101445.1 MFS transporter [Lactobacillus kefiranofaciens]
MSNFMNTLMQVGVPYIVVNKLNKSTEVSGNLQGLLSWGVFLGGILVTLIAFKNELKALKLIYFINFIVLALLGISVEWLPINIIIIFAIFEFILGLINGIADPPFFTYIQSVVPKESLGQVNTYLYTIVQLLTPFGILIYSILIESVEFQLLFLLNGFIALIIALVLLKVLKIVKE